jgi:hypothetical protein
MRFAGAFHFAEKVTIHGTSASTPERKAGGLELDLLRLLVGGALFVGTAGMVLASGCHDRSSGSGSARCPCASSAEYKPRPNLGGSFSWSASAWH